MLEANTIHRVRRIHFVGIGGAGMSGIAEVLHNLGYQVSGSDLVVSRTTDYLASLGITIGHTHDPAQIEDIDAVVCSGAIAEDNPELVAARARRITVIPRAEMLAELMRLREGIAVAGTHGKTTTTSLVASILAESRLDPTYVIGGVLNSSGSHARLGTGQYLVAEADESDASFLYLQPTTTILTNIDADHLGTYRDDIGALQESFNAFLHHLPFHGLAIVCLDDARIKAMVGDLSRPFKSYGFDPQADYVAHDVHHQGGQSWFRVSHEGEKNWLEVKLNLPGRHNVLNALAAIALAREVGVSDAAIITALAEFQGIARRCQVVGELQVADKRLLLIDDYAHHPREISAILQAVRQGWRGKKICVIFEPHRYTRTRDLFEDFCAVLSTADRLLLLDVHAAGEAPIIGADSRSLCRAIRRRGPIEPIFVERRATLVSLLKHIAADGDVILVLGAGAVSSVATELQQRYDASVSAAERRRPAAIKTRGLIKRNEPMKKHTSLRAGGCAEQYFKPADLDDLCHFLKQTPASEPLFWCGLGSNLLVRDGGLRGTVIALYGVADTIKIEECRLYAGAGAACAKVARMSVAAGLTGGEFLAGIPGTIGGALAMNAGAFGHEIWALVERVETVDRQGRRTIKDRTEFGIAYRQVICPPDEWFIGTQLRLDHDDAKQGAQQIRDLLNQRSERQPMGLASCGSVFRNPRGDHAARLIEASGLKGHGVGRAYISEKHANFIINAGGASAEDIESLIVLVREKVKSDSGVELIPEVRIVGERRTQ